MKWKQFFTPVKSISSSEAKGMVEQDGDDVILLDVRQPQEYEAAHLPGALLIPLGELDERLDELDPDKSIIVY
ncbi:MAG: hypothetical protein D6B25_14140 [Desulfobulbaceae bacterium]|nr:MAG: hypothetical protein D6B25_14140 [Desulfobulbaceae bacterium]